MKFRISGRTIESHRPVKDVEKAVRPGSWTLVREAKGPGYFVQKRMAAIQTSRTLCFQVDGFSFRADRLEREKTGGGGGSVEDLKAQFPGKVRKILVNAGTKVEAGAPLLLIEAMKMEFQIKAPTAGQVKAILVKEGQQLSPGQLLVDFVDGKS